MPRGVKKVSEGIVQDGRSFVYVENNKNNIDDIKWEDIPEGAIKINSKTGLMEVKLEGESTWVPAGIKNDGTICIAKDTKIVAESFTIASINKQTKKFTYTIDGTDSKRESYINNDKEFVFEVQEDSFMPHRNLLTVTVDDCLTRTEANGGIKELDSTHFSMPEDLKVGMKITAEYHAVVRIGNPYPRVFMHADEPSGAEIGDIWIDTDGTLADDDFLVKDTDSNKKVSWSRVIGAPTTLKGFGLDTEVQNMINRAKIDYNNIKNIPAPKPVDAATLCGHKPGTKANEILLIPTDGKIPYDLLPDKIKYENLPKFVIGGSTPSSPENNKTVWFCTASGNTGVRVYTGNKWVTLEDSNFKTATNNSISRLDNALTTLEKKINSVESSVKVIEDGNSSSSGAIGSIATWSFVDGASYTVPFKCIAIFSKPPLLNEAVIGAYSYSYGYGKDSIGTATRTYSTGKYTHVNLITRNGSGMISPDSLGLGMNTVFVLNKGDVLKFNNTITTTYNAGWGSKTETRTFSPSGYNVTCVKIG